MQVQVVSEDRDWERLEGEWRELVAASEAGSPFLQWEWVSAWWRHYGMGNQLAVLLARGNQGLVGIAPFFVEHRRPPFGPRVIRFLGTGEAFSEYLSLIARRGYEPYVTRLFLEFLFGEWRGRWDLLQLTDVPAESPMVSGLEQYFGQFEVRHRQSQFATCWRIELAESWEEFLSGLSRNRREKLRRYLRDLKKHDLEYHEVTTEAELGPAWQALRDLHQMRWSQSGEPGCFASARFTAFHTDVVPELFRRGLLSLSLLKSGDRPVAASYCLRHREVVSFYQGGVDPAWWECRPGHILRTCELRRAIERGDRVYDLLGGDMEYKAQWGTPAVTTVEFLAAAPGRWAECQFGFALAGRWMKEQARTRLSSAMWSRLRRWKQRRLAAAGSSVPTESDGPGTKDRGQAVPSELVGV